MKELLYDTPYWLLAVIAVTGIALWWSGINRQDRTLKRVGLAIVGIGVALGVAGYFLETDTEFVTRRTREMVKAVDRRDWPTFGSVFDPNVNFAMYHNRDELVEGAKKTADFIGLKSVRITGMNVQQTDRFITVDLKTYSEQERSGRPALTSWRFDWQNMGDGWRLKAITPQVSEHVRPDQIISNLSR